MPGVKEDLDSYMNRQQAGIRHFRMKSEVKYSLHQ